MNLQAINLLRPIIPNIRNRIKTKGTLTMKSTIDDNRQHLMLCLLSVFRRNAHIALNMYALELRILCLSSTKARYDTCFQRKSLADDWHSINQCFDFFSKKVVQTCECFEQCSYRLRFIPTMSDRYWQSMIFLFVLDTPGAIISPKWPSSECQQIIMLLGR